MPKVPFAPLVTASTDGGSMVLDRLMHQARRTFDSLDHSYVAKPADRGTNGQVLLLGSDGIPVWSSRAGVAQGDGEQVLEDLVPTLQRSLLLVAGGVDVARVTLPRERHYRVTAMLTSFINGGVTFTETQLIRVSNKIDGTVAHMAPDVVLHTYGGFFTFAATTSPDTLTLTTTNGSANDQMIQVIASATSARTVVS